MNPLSAAPALIVAFMLLAPAAAQERSPDPKAYREGAMQNPNLHNTDGEQFAWHARGPANDLVDGYEAFGDLRWLEEAITYFDFLIAQLKEDPDGYKGWIGQTIWGITGRADHDAYRADALVGDAILLAPMVRFAEIVLANEQLEQRFGDQARQYIELARHIGWEKWNHRGTYYRCAAGYGSYRMHETFIDAETWQWTPAPIESHSDNLNKHHSMGLVFLRLWRITGEEEYRQRVEEIYSRMKSLFRYYPEEDRVVWNFWMPHGPHDVRGVDRLASWVAVHPRSAGYQGGEVGRFVEVYDSGLVFDRDDLQRMINTNHWMMLNGEWRSADGDTDAGQLWSALARFDEKIMERHRRSVMDGSGDRNLIRQAYFQNVAMQRLGWDRRFVEDEAEVRVYDHPPQPGTKISMGLVIPNRIGFANDQKAYLATQTRAAGELKIELLDEMGEQVLGTLHARSVPDRGWTIAPAWDGTNPATGRKEPGKYLVRWTLGDESRTQPVWIGEREERLN